MSISKEPLVSWDRIRGCENDNHQLEFAHALEYVFGRFAFPDQFVISVASLRKAILSKYSKESSDLGKAVRSIRELSVYPHAGWSDTTKIPITFIAVLEGEGQWEIDDREKIVAEIKSKIDAITRHAPFELHEDVLIAATLSDLTTADYLNSYPLDVNSLSLARRYQK